MNSSIDFNEIAAEMVTFRRWMHQHPELSENEVNTAAAISNILDKYNIEHQCNIGGHGIVAIVRGKRCNNTVALKADIDALPIDEKNSTTYKSQNKGVMHACGHDANTAIALGTAIALKQQENSLEGNIKFFFEPAEETIGGGQYMVSDGCMNNPLVSSIVGIHVMPYIETGKVEIKSGCLNAGSDEIEITVHGKPGHAAEPENCVDPIVAMSYIITSLQTLISRNIAATDSAVLTFGIINGGTKGNIIPEIVYTKGTLRTLTQMQRVYMRQRVKAIAENVAIGLGARAEVNIHESYDPLINNNELVSLVERESKKMFGKNSVIIRETPSMGAEDFAYYTKSAKGVYFHIGCKSTKEIDSCSLHTDTFHLDEKCIKNGIKLLTSILPQILNEEVK